MSDSLRNLFIEKPLTAIAMVLILSVFGGFGGSYSGGFFGKNDAIAAELNQLKLQFLTHVEWDVGRKELLELKVQTGEETIDELRARIQALEKEQIRFRELLRKEVGGGLIPNVKE